MAVKSLAMAPAYVMLNCAILLASRWGDFTLVTTH